MGRIAISDPDRVRKRGSGLKKDRVTNGGSGSLNQKKGLVSIIAYTILQYYYNLFIRILTTF